MKKITKLSEMFGEGTFIEEEYALGITQYVKHETPVEISESNSQLPKGTKCFGIAEGIFGVLDGESRNKRFYPEDFWRSIVDDPIIQARVNARAMQGTIGHHDKPVCNKDWAAGIISHVLTKLWIDEETRTVRGRLEILDTPAGRLLKEYYEKGLPVYVSSRGAGKLIKRIGEELDVVDKNNYYLHTWDIVNDPGFLEARPEYKPTFEGKLNSIQEDLTIEQIEKTDIVLEDTKDIEENIEMKLDGSMEELIKSLLNPLQESVANLNGKVTKIVEESEEAKKEAEEKAKKEAEEKEAEEKAEKEAEMKKLEEAKASLESEVASLKEQLSSIKEEADEEDKEDKEDEKEEADEEDKEEVDEAKIYEAKFAEMEKVSETLLEMVKTFNEEKTKISEEIATERVIHEETKKLLEEALLDLNSRKLAEEFGITIEEAKAKLSGVTIEEAKKAIQEEKDADKDKEDKKDEEEAKEKIEKDIEDKKDEKIEESKAPAWIKSSFINESKSNAPEKASWIKSKIK